MKNQCCKWFCVELEESYYDNCNGCDKSKNIQYEICVDFLTIKLCSKCYEDLKIRLTKNLKGEISW